jgi:hypothetical protein
MRIIAFVLASALAACFIMEPASAATKRSAAGTETPHLQRGEPDFYRSGEVANPDRSVYPNSRGCTPHIANLAADRAYATERAGALVAVVLAATRRGRQKETPLLRDQEGWQDQNEARHWLQVRRALS